MRLPILPNHYRLPISEAIALQKSLREQILHRPVDYDVGVAINREDAFERVSLAGRFTRRLMRLGGPGDRASWDRKPE